MKKSEFTIKEFTYPSGLVAYRLNGMLDGKQVRRFFPTIEEARAKRTEYECDLAKIKPPALVATKLTPEQAEEAELAYAELKGTPHSLIGAVRWTIANYSDPQKKIPVAEAFAKFIADKRSANLRAATLRTLNQRVGRLVRTFPQVLVSDVQAEQLKDLIFRPGSGKVNQESDWRSFNNFFNWSKGQGYCAVNPMERITRITLDREEPEILPLDRVRALLDAATTFKQGVCVPYVVLGLFCAIRPTELARLDWAQIDLTAGTVTIGSKLAKMRQRRIVEIPENAIPWLLPHAVKKTPLCGANWRKDFDAIKEMAGFGTPSDEKPALTPWTPDALRHTGISHHLAMHQHEGKTATWAGNSPTIIQQHYRGLVKQSETQEFWSTTPDSRKILPLLPPALSAGG